MKKSLISSIYALMCLVISAHAMDQCPDLPAPIRFFRGRPTGLEPELTQFNAMFQNIFMSLGSVFQGAGKIAPHHSENVTIPLEMVSDESTVAPQPTSGPQEVGSTTAPSASPIGRGTSSGGTKKPFSFDFQHFFNNILAPHKDQNATEGKGEQPKAHIRMSFGAPPPPSGAEEEIDQQETTWSVSVPLNTVRLQMVKFNRSEVVDTFVLHAEDFVDRNRTRVERRRFVRDISLADYDLVPDLYYAVCVDLAVSQDDLPGTCRWCSLLKPCQELDCSQDRVVVFQAPNSKVHPYDARLHFFVYDLPVKNVSLVTRVQPRAADSRCDRRRARGLARAENTVITGADADQPFDKFERADRLFPHTVLYLTVPHLQPYEAYGIRGDLALDLGGVLKSPRADNELMFEGETKILARDYLGAYPKEYIIGACTRI